MSMTLVPRFARSLSDHINQYYRVFRGVDPDSLAVRLPSGGSFQIQHSVTASPVLHVTDAGLDGSDIWPSSISSDKLASGIPVPPNSITTNEIADFTITANDIDNAQILTQHIAGGQVTTSKLAAHAVSQAWYDTATALFSVSGALSWGLDSAASGLNVSFTLPAAAQVLTWVTAPLRSAVANRHGYLGIQRGGTGSPQISAVQHFAAVNTPQIANLQLVEDLPAGSYVYYFALQNLEADTGVSAASGDNRTMTVLAVYR